MSNQNQNQKQPKNNKTAAVHSGGIRNEAKKTRVVFKNVLDTPFNIPWPEVSKDNNTLVLDMLCDLVKPVKEFHNNQPNKELLAEKKAKIQKKPSKNDSQIQLNPALAVVSHDTATATTKSTGSSLTTEPTSNSQPPILGSIIIGINAVTKSLERSIQDLATNAPPSAIFLCKGDLVPSHLYSHLGPMIAMLPNVKLFPFLRGSEKQLTEALGMQAVGALAIKAGGGGVKDAEGLIMILDRMVDPINVPWLPKVKVPAKKPSPKSKEPEKPESKTQTEPISVNVTEKKKDTNSDMDIDKDSENWIATNIKSIKTTMPIVVKAPKSVETPGDKGQNSSKNKNNNNDNGNNNSNNNNSKGGKDKNTQQQKQQSQQKSQQQQQQQKHQDKQNQSNKHPSDNPNQERGKSKKSKTS
ncbi:hypothetical protein BGZ76_007794 [Entomortierella beljakovae]|nr:hypothetical protein BGZ76_007794 [Entomortierella beljakovae]